jgi:hypothetical protein
MLLVFPEVKSWRVMITHLLDSKEICSASCGFDTLSFSLG